MSTNKAPQQKKAPVIQINQEVLHNNLSDYVRKNLEDVLNELLDAEADRLCHAKRYERNAERASTRAGSYKRNFETTSGKVTLNIPKLRNLPFGGFSFLVQDPKWSYGVRRQSIPVPFPPENLPRPVIYSVLSLPA